MSKESLVERYRPQSLDDVVGQPFVLEKVRGLMAKEGGIEINLLFSGIPGVGKTTVAKCIAREMEKKYDDEVPGPHWLSFHHFAGGDLSIADIKGDISRLTEFRGKRVIFIDEADGLNMDKQKPLAKIMEGKNAIFILSCNDDNKLGDLLKSRCSKFKFSALKAEDIRNRLLYISREEGVLEPGAPPMIQRFYSKLSREAQGDMRAAINELETYISNGKLNLGLVEMYVGE